MADSSNNSLQAKRKLFDFSETVEESDDSVSDFKDDTDQDADYHTEDSGTSSSDPVS